MHQSGRFHRLATTVTASLGPKIEAVDVIVQVDRSWQCSRNLVFDCHVPPLEHAQMTVVGVASDFIF